MRNQRLSNHTHVCVCVCVFSVPKFLGSGMIQTWVCLLPEPRHFPLLVNSLNILNIAMWKLWCWFYRWKPEGQKGAGPHPNGFQNLQKSSQGWPQIQVWWRSGQTVNLGGLKWHSVLASLSFPHPPDPRSLSSPTQPTYHILLCSKPLQKFPAAWNPSPPAS